MTSSSTNPAELDAVLRAIQGGASEESTVSEARFRAVASSMVDGVVTINERGIIDFINAAAERMFGYEAGALVGQNVSRLMPPDPASRHDEYLRGYLRSHESRAIGITRELIGLRADGTEFPLELSVSEVSVHRRRIWTGVFREVSRRRQQEEQLRAAQQAAIADNIAKATCLRSINHHLRTSLTPILGYAELLQDERLTEHQQELVSGIQRNAQQLLAELSRHLDLGLAAISPQTHESAGDWLDELT